KKSLVEPELVREGKKTEKQMKVGFLSNLDQHVKMIGGEVYNKEVDDQGIIDAIISHKALIESDLIVGEVITYPEIITKDGSSLKIRIKGVFEAASTEDTYWVTAPSEYVNECFIDKETFYALFYEQGLPTRSMEKRWTLLFDYTTINVEQATNLLNNSKYIISEAEKSGFTGATINFDQTIEQYIIDAKHVNITMWILLVPIFVLLAAFIFMVSRQMLDIEQNEIAVLKSRGVSKRQIIFVYLLQSVILSSIGFIVGIPIGYGLCKVLGASNAFMEFVGRKALTVEIDARTIAYAAVAAVFSIGVMTLPVFKHSNVSIVEEKQRKSIKSQPLWQRMFMDVILFAISIYGLYNFNGQKAALAEKVAAGQALDPLLFLNSSLFIFSAGLISLRLIPFIAKVIYYIGKKFWSPALYASFLHVLRTKRKQGFITVFLVLTIAMGIFNANTARTINKNEEDRVLYDVGADVVLQEVWPNNSSLLKMFPELELVHYEPDYWKYKKLVEIESMTRVIRDKYTIMNYNGPNKGVELMAINSKEFGQTAWLRDGILDAHWYEYLNCLAQNPRAVLVSANMQTNLGMKLGDIIYYENSAEKTSMGTVSGFVSAWPTYKSTKTQKAKDGTEDTIDHYLIIANFDQVQNDYGIIPYEIWIKTKGSSSFLYDFAEDNEVNFAKFEDTSAQLTELKNNPVFQVTNGVLTINFIIVLVLCTAGFLIYWISSIRSRELLFGVYRAMGMSMREVWSMLINEHVFISLLSIGIGVLIGTISSRLFIPLIEITYAPAGHTLPTIFATSNKDMIQLAVVIVGMLVFCVAVLGVIISKIKISQALKLGEE
ncbi:MAG: ABC transporter permease, partial [Mobilitalea sp.]